MSRAYADGLMTSDPEEDTVFMVWYRHHPAMQTKGDGLSTFDVQLHDTKDAEGNKLRKYQERLNSEPIPELKAKPNLLVCRARSKLERDSWCWALNCEIERLARASQIREQRARERGHPVSFGDIKEA